MIDPSSFLPQTIFALSSAPGRGGVAVVRVSGPRAWDSLARLTGGTVPTARVAAVRSLRAPASGALIDQALVLGFRGPASFTGEDVVEYHVHGGVSVVRALVEALSVEAEHRLAAPGEFTRRAFENGKMDLTAAEAVGDLINAETEAQRLQALQQMDGVLSRLYDGWKDRLAKVLAYMEADLDFSDQDLPDDLLLKVRPNLSDLRAEIVDHLADNRRGERLRDGFHLVVLGAPNAGKSSLVNALVQRDVAIVSPLAGTTRDLLEAHLDIGGYPVIIVDTAGLRPEQLGDEGHDAIESEGIRRALARARQADVKILLYDVAVGPDAHILNLLDDHAILVANKCDTGVFESVSGSLPLSVKTGAGLESLLQQIAKNLDFLRGPGESPSLTRLRHRQALERTVAALDRSVLAPLPELAAEDLRLAIRFLGEITGRVDVEDLLDMIFRDFCIGK